MGKIVGATLCTHVPRLMLPKEKRDAYIGKKKSSFFEALPKMYVEKIKPLEKAGDPVTFVVIDTHWWSTDKFLINGQTVLEDNCYVSDEMPDLICDYAYRYNGDQELADLIQDETDKTLLKDRVMVVKKNGHFMHYPTLVTMLYLNPENKHRVLPMSVVYTSSIDNEEVYGRALGKAILRGNRKVILVATGGLSHSFRDFDAIPSHRSPDSANVFPDHVREFDCWIMGRLKAGDHKSILDQNIINEFRRTCLPEGRFAHYLRMVHALGGNQCRLRGEQYGEYEAAIGTGQAIFWFDIPDSREEKLE